ncbi:P22 phage major capsid protein family protein [Timonella senegalensis]|uniref:P22 phage major capsid protein family protein n=1 Tax=Timonella senegalensis TaxID=1465825 RepID=UPI0028B01E59|nr:P22 phage major capsid protein family protein [Timonella senegalensis]
MPNVFEKPEVFAATALELLRKEIKGAGLFVHKFGQADYAGAKGDVVNLKRPPILRARDAGFRTRNALVVDDIVQSKIQVKLTKHPYSRVELSPEEATLDEVDYVRDVQAPQVRAIVEDFDESIAAALKGATFVHSVDFTAGATGAVGDPRKVARKAKRLLDSSKVPAAGRYWLVGAAVSEEIANCDKLLEVDASGLPEALRDGVVGKLSGFIIIDWPSLGDDEGYFTHETAVALSAVAPVVPRGAAAGATISADGLAVTQVWDYQSATLADQSTVHAFTGATPVTDPKLKADGTVQITGGNVVFEFVRAVKTVFTEATEPPVGG